MNRLAKLKVTCCAGKLRGKLDLLGENHEKIILDIKSKMCLQRQVLAEKEGNVAKLSERCQKSNGSNHTCTNMCPVEKANAIRDMKKERSNMNPGFAILFDNIDGSLNRRHMTMENQNLDYHWVNHKIVVNRVSGNKFDKSPRDILNVSNHRFLPTVQDQKRQRQNYIVLVARILVEHLECFKVFKDVCVSHIPHKYSKELAVKSQSVSTKYKI